MSSHERYTKVMRTRIQSVRQRNTSSKHKARRHFSEFLHPLFEGQHTVNSIGRHMEPHANNPPQRLIIRVTKTTTVEITPDNHTGASRPSKARQVPPFHFGTHELMSTAHQVSWVEAGPTGGAKTGTSRAAKRHG
ncbi:uncharacterized protein EI90DRAFT_3017404 [Cantharellus anzutake]|uniref:uncharacterized protein n=1 Tax=Cantharellus anzutake TaxID=1750568 RepID=UPI0019045B75|nr:uncharacterized protein EI90DRAFT_3017404 [Cantharellus anzutake]KAF8329169.1 hypothetical protein EI90DRAFT_3017404 [Cantharellus anzutake]